MIRRIPAQLSSALASDEATPEQLPVFFVCFTWRNKILVVSYVIKPNGQMQIKFEWIPENGTKYAVMH